MGGRRWSWHDQADTGCALGVVCRAQAGMRSALCVWSMCVGVLVVDTIAADVREDITTEALCLGIALLATQGAFRPAQLAMVAQMKRAGRLR